MIDIFEHVLLYAICVLIMRVSLPLPIFEVETPAGRGDNNFGNQIIPDAVIGTSVAGAMAVPLWLAFEVIYWVGASTSSHDRLLGRLQLSAYGLASYDEDPAHYMAACGTIAKKTLLTP